mmetsp:Transcript_5982/g.19955  ORF Transcript_5982/g.19955 Transcript_5982/m.19955 type:complete len:205 (+) Transcript_5982:282-896(+)
MPRRRARSSAPPPPSPSACIRARAARRTPPAGSCLASRPRARAASARAAATGREPDLSAPRCPGAGRRALSTLFPRAPRASRHRYQLRPPPRPPPPARPPRRHRPASAARRCPRRAGLPTRPATRGASNRLLDGRRRRGNHGRRGAHVELVERREVSAGVHRHLDRLVRQVRLQFRRRRSSHQAALDCTSGRRHCRRPQHSLTR